MSKVKMRCARCGKPFKASGAKQTLCPECEFKARRERANEKAAGSKAAAAPTVIAQAPRIVGPGAAILGGSPTPATVPSPGRDTGAATPHADHTARDHGPQSQHMHPRHDTHAEHTTATASPPRPPSNKGDRAEKQPRAAARPAAERQPRPEKKPRPAPFELTDETRRSIESRYLELAQPVEFDGIRTQIANELTVPKYVVKQVVRELRSQRQLPSWWELKSYTGSTSDLGRIREAYIPQLPLPAIGVHKAIAEQLSLDPANVYHAIRRIRAEMRLPQYNPPDARVSTNGEPTEAGVILGQDGAS